MDTNFSLAALVVFKVIVEGPSSYNGNMVGHPCPEQGDDSPILPSSHMDFTKNKFYSPQLSARRRKVPNTNISDLYPQSR